METQNPRLVWDGKGLKAHLGAVILGLKNTTAPFQEGFSENNDLADINN